MTQDTSQVKTDLWMTFGLLFVGGYCDAAGFILTHTFAGHFTGNLVLFGISLASHDFSYAVRELIALGTFPMGVVLSILVTRRFSLSVEKRILPYILSAEIVLFALATLPLKSHSEFHVQVEVFCLSLALGLQTGAFHHVRGGSIHSTYVRGMITNLIAMLARRGENAPNGEASVQGEPSRGFPGWFWAAFVAGCIVGTKLILTYRSLGLLGEIPVLAALVVRTAVAARTVGDAPGQLSDLGKI
jgi:uncharacterized membrane protein YoaK (UPF0700 family)